MKTRHLIAIAGTLFMASCKQKQQQQPSDPTVMVKTVSVHEEPFALPVRSSGVISSDKESRLSFKTGGIIARLLVNEGDQVRKGQLLATLDQTELDAQLAVQRNTLEKARRDLDRNNKLYRDSSATLEELENSRTGVTSAQQNYRIAKFNKIHASIYANRSGRVIRKLVNEGEITNPGAVVYIINSTEADDWVVKLGVTDRDWARIKLGDRALLTTDSYPDQQLQATVSEVGEGADVVTGTFLIKVKVQPGQFRLANGLAAKVEIKPSAQKQFRFIPVDALVEANEESATVYSPAADGRSVRKHKVGIVYVLGDRVAISAGLNGVRQVITDGAAYLTPSSKIKILNQTPSRTTLNVKP